MRFLEDINVRQEIIDIYKNSFLYEIIMWITNILIPRLKYDFIHSKTLAIILKYFLILKLSAKPGMQVRFTDIPQ